MNVARLTATVSPLQNWIVASAVFPTTVLDFSSNKCLLYIVVIQRLVAPAAASATVALYSISDAHAKEASDLVKVRESIVDLMDSDAERRGDGTSLGKKGRILFHYHERYACSMFVSLQFFF